jgi:hypothetical protein
VGFAALITWFAAVLAGLYMFTVWLIENDVTARHTAPSQLPVPVIFTHLVLAVTGLGVWVAYLVLDRETLAWTAFGVLCLIALLGVTMFARWIPVYRDPATASDAAKTPAYRDTATVGHSGQGQYPLYGQTAAAGRPGQIPVETSAVPAEGNFPVAVVAIHGLLAGSTLVLVFLTALGVGGS